MKTMTAADLRRRAHFHHLDVRDAPRGRIHCWLYMKRRLLAWLGLWSVIGLCAPLIPGSVFGLICMMILTSLTGSGKVPGNTWGP
jgi:hypothetical protein